MFPSPLWFAIQLPAFMLLWRSNNALFLIIQKPAASLKANAIMPELEYILMNKTSQPYRICRQLVLDSRQTLGIGKYEPWTENLHDAAMRLYAARYGPSLHKTDADSTTISSYSLDGSEEILHSSHDKHGTVELIMEAMDEGGRFEGRSPPCTRNASRKRQEEEKTEDEATQASRGSRSSHAAPWGHAQTSWDLSSPELIGLNG
jgi:hypothetical protein